VIRNYGTTKPVTRPQSHSGEEKSKAAKINKKTKKNIVVSYGPPPRPRGKKKEKWKRPNLGKIIQGGVGVGGGGGGRATIKVIYASETSGGCEVSIMAA